jgi:hypothetical protein
MAVVWRVLWAQSTERPNLPKDSYFLPSLSAEAMLQRVRRLESRTLRHFMEKPQIDLDAVKTRLEAGEPLKAIANGLSIPASTLRSRLHKANDSAPSPRKSPVRREASDKSNGHTTDGDLAALDALLDSRWRALSRVERVTVLLSH